MADCFIDFTNWLGNPAVTFNKNGLLEYVLVVAAGPNKYCFRGSKATNCYSRAGFTDDNKTIEFISGD
jgi:hypothetical protein